MSHSFQPPSVIQNLPFSLAHCLPLIASLHRNGGEYPRAFVVRKEGVASEAELSEMIKAQFAPHKWLTGGVYFLDEIPRTGSGKVMRRNLPVLEHEAAIIRGRL